MWSDDITQRPGYLALDADDHTKILQSAIHYLRNADPSDDAWLDTPNVTDKRPMAGYLAFALLDRMAPEQLTALSPGTWGRWASTLLWFDCTILNGGSPERKRSLLARTEGLDSPLYCCAHDSVHSWLRRSGEGRIRNLVSYCLLE